MNTFLNNLQQVYLTENNPFSINPDLESLNRYEQIAEIGQLNYFLKNNLNECIELFGVSITSELIESADNEFKSLLNEGKFIPDNVSPKTASQDLWDTIKSHSNEIGWTVLTALVLTAAYKIYKNYLSKAARACKGKTGEEKTACMTNYQTQAYKLKKQALKKSLSFANKTKKPDKFKQKINNEIKKLDKKIR